MNLQPEEKQAEIVLPSPEGGISELLRLAKLLHSNPKWRTTHFSGESGPSSSTKLTEARGDIQRSVWKLEKILEEVKNV